MSAYLRAVLFWLCVVLIVSFALVQRGHSHDAEHPELDAWYHGLMMPDLPTSSCCGEADAYWCDDYYTKQTADGPKNFCKITDDRAVPKRPPIPVGTEIEIPTHKLKWDAGNPTGHNIVFLSASGLVYCFVQTSGS